MVGSITPRLFYSLSLVPFASCDDASNSFLFLFLFLCVLFSRVEWFEWDRQMRRNFPSELMMLMRLESTRRRFTRAIQKKNATMRASLLYLFSFVTRINSILYCLFFFIRILRLLLLKILRLERRNECSLQSRKNSTRTSTREAWWT